MPARYRLRRGLFGKSVLQQLVEFMAKEENPLAGKGTYTAWRDVPFDHAPAEMREAPHAD